MNRPGAERGALVGVRRDRLGVCSELRFPMSWQAAMIAEGIEILELEIMVTRIYIAGASG